MPAFVQIFLDWIKSTFNIIKNYLDNNFLIMLIVVSAVVVLLFYVISRIFSSRNYNKIVARKFKKLNIIIRNNQIKEDREIFLAEFNKEVTKKDRVFGPVWNKYLKAQQVEPSYIFKDSNIRPNKVSFLNFYLFFSLVVCFSCCAILMSVKKFDFRGENSIYILVFVPLFIIAISCLFNIIYTGARKRNAKALNNHFSFFIQNIDDAVKGFTKNDFRLSGGARLIVDKASDPNVSTYEDFKRSGASTISQEDEEYLQDQAEKKLADKISSEGLSNITHIKTQPNAVMPKEPIQSEDEESDEQQQALLSSLEKLRNIDQELEDEENNQEADTLVETKPFELDDEDDVGMSLEELIQAKRARMADKDNTLRKPRTTKKTVQSKSAKSTTKRTKGRNTQGKSTSGKKNINDALSDLLDATKKSRIKSSKK